MSLVARHLEANGIPTVIIGSARDIVEHCGVARFLYTDFPLGNPCGRPYDREMQDDLIRQGLALFDQSLAPRTTVQTPFIWGKDEQWRDLYLRVDDSNREELKALGKKRREQQAAVKASGQTRAPMISQ